VGKPRTGARLGATCVIATAAILGLTGCENLGKKAAEAVTQPSKPPHHHRPSGPTEQAARAFLHQTFVLYDHGRARRGCTFSESKPYLAVDRRCVSESQKVVAQFHAHGLSVVPTTIAVHVHDTRGTATFTWVVNGHRARNSAFLRYDGHRWWMTGEPKTGDRGL
jgi:hypothetical protein